METEECLIVVDFEATCDDGGRIQPHEMEIIEIGAVKVNRKTGEVLDSFQAVVCPTIHPYLSSFCMRLTGIQQQGLIGTGQNIFSQIYIKWDINILG